MSNCPSCNSGNTKKMQMVWAGGSRVSQRRSTGVGLSSRGTIGIGVGRGTSHSQSHLAAACAPPKKSRLPLVVVGVLFFMIWLPMFKVAISGLNDGHIMSAILGFPVLALITFGLYRLYLYLAKKNNKEIDEYSKTWVCLKCGNTFI